MAFVWLAIAAGALGFTLYRWLKWRKDDARAKKEWKDRVDSQKKR